MNPNPPSLNETIISLQRALNLPPIYPPHPPHPTLTAALLAFRTAFDQWKPTHLYLIEPCDKPVIDFVFSDAACGTHRDQNTNQILSHCQYQIQRMVGEWNRTRNATELTKDDYIVQIVSIIQSDTWDVYQDFHTNHYQQLRSKRGIGVCNEYGRLHSIDLALPTIEMLQHRLNELDQIQEYLSVQIHDHDIYTIHDILQKYKSSYGIFMYEDSRYNRPVKRTQLENLQENFGPKPDDIYLLTYFYLYPSILFGDCDLRDPKRSRDHYPHADTPNKTYHRNALNTKRQRITQAFGSDMTYEGVVNAIQLLETNTKLNLELQILLSCERLEITALDVTNFRAVQLLYDISIPLQAFIQTCVQCNFTVVKSDTSFQTLQTECTNFYSTKSNDRQTCLSFFDRLYTLLCFPQQNDHINGNNEGLVHTSSYITLLHKINELRKAIPKLLPVSYVSYGPKLWQYFNEMKWIDRRNNTANDENAGNCIQFYNDYDTLCTTLSNYGAVNEPSIVESLGPVVRLFAKVDTLNTCVSINELVMTVHNDTETHRMIQGTLTIKKDINQLNTRILSIKDLFGSICSLQTTARVPVTRTVQSRFNSPQETNQPTTVASGVSTNSLPTVQFASSSPQPQQIRQPSTPQATPSQPEQSAQSTTPHLAATTQPPLAQNITPPSTLFATSLPQQTSRLPFGSSLATNQPTGTILFGSSLDFSQATNQPSTVVSGAPTNSQLTFQFGSSSPLSLFGVSKPRRRQTMQSRTPQTTLTQPEQSVQSSTPHLAATTQPALPQQTLRLPFGSSLATNQTTPDASGVPKNSLPTFVFGSSLPIPLSQPQPRKTMQLTTPSQPEQSVQSSTPHLAATTQPPPAQNNIPPSTLFATSVPQQTVQPLTQQARTSSLFLQTVLSPTTQPNTFAGPSAPLSTSAAQQAANLLPNNHFVSGLEVTTNIRCTGATITISFRKRN